MGRPVTHFEIGCPDLAETGESSQFAWLQDPAGNVIGLLKRKA